MKTINSLLILTLSCFAMKAQSPWSYLKQGTPTWPGADTKDVYVGDNYIVSCGDIGLIDTYEGEIYIVKTDLDGNLIWDQHIDKPGTMEIVQRISYVPSDSGFLITSVLADGYRPWIIKIDKNGNLMWSSESWTDSFSENSASQTFAYQLPSGDDAIIVAEDVYQYLIRNTVSNSTGALITSDTILYNAIFDDDYVVQATNDIISTYDGGFAICGYQTTPDSSNGFIATFDAAFNLSFFLAAGVWSDKTWSALNLIELSPTNFLLCGVSKQSVFFGDNYTSCLVGISTLYGLTYSYEFLGDLLNSYAFDITKTLSGYRIINYVFSGDTWGTDPGDYVEEVNLNSDFSVVDRSTLDYAPYNVFNVIRSSGTDDRYYLGGTSWQIGIPSYYTLIASDISGILPECVFNCVWPGDASNDGTVNMDDLLSVGLAWGTSGPARTATDNDWYPHASNEWTDMLPDGTNYKYADCNGNGVINNEDTTAIALNFDLTHPVYSLKLASDAPPIYLDTPLSPLSVGYNEIGIILGDIATPVDEIYGLRFIVQYEGTSIDKNSVKASFNASWLGSSSEILGMYKNDATIGDIQIGITRKDQNNIGGQGQIGTLGIVVIDNIAGKETAGTGNPISFSISNIYAIKATGEEVLISPVSTTVETDTSTDIQNIQAPENISLYPNPLNGNQIYIEGINENLISVNMFDAIGNEINGITFNTQNNSIQIPNIETGNYYFKIKTEKIFIMKQFTVLR